MGGYVPSFTGGNLRCCASRYVTLRILNAATGEEVWSRNDRSVEFSPSHWLHLESDGQVRTPLYANVGSSYLQRVNRWTIHGRLASTGSDKTAYRPIEFSRPFDAAQTGPEGNLYLLYNQAFSPAQLTAWSYLGELLWTRDLASSLWPTWGFAAAPRVLVDQSTGTVFTAVHVIEPGGAAQVCLESWTANGESLGVATVANASSTVLALDDSGNFGAYKASDGTLHLFDSSMTSQGSPVVGYVDPSHVYGVYFPGDGTAVVVYRSESGSEYSTIIRLVTPDSGVNSILYNSPDLIYECRFTGDKIVDFDGVDTVRSINLETGSVDWEYFETDDIGGPYGLRLTISATPDYVAIFGTRRNKV